MVRLAEEHRQISRNSIHQLLDFCRVAGLQHLAVGLEGVESQVPQPPGQPAIDQILLGLGQHNTGLLVDQRPDTVKILRGKREFVFNVHGADSVPLL